MFPSEELQDQVEETRGEGQGEVSFLLIAFLEPCFFLQILSSASGILLLVFSRVFLTLVIALSVID